MIPLLLTTFSLLTISTAYLLYWLRLQAKFTRGLATFNKEMVTVAIILIVFDLTYLLRAGWDHWGFEAESLFVIFSVTILLGVIFDIIPLSLIFYFHYKNFRIIESQADDD